MRSDMRSTHSYMCTLCFIYFLSGSYHYTLAASTPSISDIKNNGLTHTTPSRKDTNSNNNSTTMTPIVTTFRQPDIPEIPIVILPDIIKTVIMTPPILTVTPKIIADVDVSNHTVSTESPTLFLQKELNTETSLVAAQTVAEKITEESNMFSVSTKAARVVLQTRADPPLVIMTRKPDNRDHPVLQGLVVFREPPVRLTTTASTPDGFTSNGTSIIADLHIYGKKTFADPVYKYVVPIVLAICLLIMFVFVYVLSKKLHKASSEMSKASCLLLLIIAAADVLTMAFALAEIGYLYEHTDTTLGLLPFSSCKTMLVLERLSAIPHASSTWFTVILAVQRYMCVSKPFSAGKYISLKSSCIYALIVGVLSIIFHVYRFFDSNFKEMIFPGKLDSLNITTCDKTYAEWVHDSILYESLFSWTRIAIMQIIPCFIIVSFVWLMINSLRKTARETKRLKLQAAKLASNRHHLSIFVAVVAVIVVSVETSAGIFLSFNAWQITTGQKIFSYNSLKTASIAFDLILYVSYFAIFLIYCLMSKEFRQNMRSACSMTYCRKLKRRGVAAKHSTDTKSDDTAKLTPQATTMTSVKSSISDKSHKDITVSKL